MSLFNLRRRQLDVERQMPIKFGEIPEAELESSHTRGMVEVNVSRMPAEEQGVRFCILLTLSHLPRIAAIPFLSFSHSPLLDELHSLSNTTLLNCNKLEICHSFCALPNLLPPRPPMVHFDPSIAHSFGHPLYDLFIGAAIGAIRLL